MDYNLTSFRPDCLMQKIKNTKKASLMYVFLILKAKNIAISKLFKFLINAIKLPYHWQVWMFVV